MAVPVNCTFTTMCRTVGTTARRLFRKREERYEKLLSSFRAAVGHYRTRAANDAGEFLVLSSQARQGQHQRRCRGKAPTCNKDVGAFARRVYFGGTDGAGASAGAVFVRPRRLRS